MDFQAKFRERLAKIDREMQEMRKPKKPKAKPRYQAEKTLEVQEGPTYNIHKRSLPAGLDVPVMFGLTKKEADAWVSNLKHTRTVFVKGCDDKIIIYYDAVLADGKKHDIFENSKVTLVKEDIPKVHLETNGGDEIRWEG